MHEECLGLVLDRFGFASPFPILLNNCNIQLTQESTIQELVPGKNEKPLTSSENSKKLRTQTSVEIAQKKELEDKKLRQATSKLQAVAVVREESEEDDSDEDGAKNLKKGKISETEETTNDKEGKFYATLFHSLDGKLKTQISSSLMAQHFSILRELQQYCLILKENVTKEGVQKDELMKNFEHLSELLEAGCDFLYYPIQF